MSEAHFPQPISEQIWNQKYRFQTKREGFNSDNNIVDTWNRIASACADLPRLHNDQEAKEALKQRFFDSLKDFKFLPAGRINSGAGTDRNVTLFNCLSADTKILTLEYGLIPIGLIADELVHILDGNGEWVAAPINSFGKQTTASVNLIGGYDRRQRESINATKGHRWILSDGVKVTTEELKAGDVLKTVYRKNVDMFGDYHSGVQHGIIYGAGSKAYGSNKFHIHFCKNDTELSKYFPTWTKITPPLYKKDLIYFGTNNKEMKKLPIGESVEYMTGFLRGWFATKGWVSKQYGKPFLSCEKDELSWITQFGSICGMEVSYSSKFTDIINYNQRNKEIFNVSFSRWTMIPEDFLNSKHSSNFKPLIMNWTVESVSCYGDPEPVYCPSVSTTESFQLGRGIHTSNCYVMGTIPDSLKGIMDSLKEAAVTMQQGGGIGYDFSTLRPKGAPVKGVESFSSGPLTFMDVWDSMCKTIMSAGSRRGAMMATMRCDHPDILEFVHAKQDPLRLRNFNVSVLVTDKFMKAVENDDDWVLHHKIAPKEPVALPMGATMIDDHHIYEIIKARSLWNTILQSTYDYAEPGVIFIDRINTENNLWFEETIAATNPCGEQPLPPYGACLLGSVNLAKHVSNPFTEQASVDLKELEKSVRTGVRLLDSVIETSLFPLDAQKYEARFKRRQGLGITGLADMLFMTGHRYGSRKSLNVTEEIMQYIASWAYTESIKMAQEMGPAPCLESLEARKQFIQSGFMKRMPEFIKNNILKHGIRNSHLLSVAPTGTISMYAGNVSSGGEPIFAPEYTRKVTNDDGTIREEKVFDYAVLKFHEHFNNHQPFDENAKNKWWNQYMATAQDLGPADHINMQATLQKWVDSSISKTVNLPENILFDDFREVYNHAYETNCKGCTTYRPNKVTGSVLSVEIKEETPEIKPEYNGDLRVLARPHEVSGSTYKCRWGNDSYYVTFNNVIDPDYNWFMPFETFINSKNVEHHQWTAALTRMISAVFQRGGDVRFVVEELKQIHDPKGGQWVDGKYCPSLVALIGHKLKEHLNNIGYQSTTEKVPLNFIEEEIQPKQLPDQSVPDQCPNCKGFNLITISGCPTCKDCGHSKCD